MKRIVLLAVTICLVLCSVLGYSEEAQQTITFESDNYSVGVGKSITLKAIISPKKNIKLEWTSSNEEVATVSAKGAVKGVSVGETTITVKAVDSDSISASCKVTVVIPVKKISFTDKNVSMAVDTTWQLDANITPENATNKDIEWTSSNEKVATVNEAGIITGVSKGSAKITATAVDGGKAKGVINVKVNEYDMVFTSDKPQKAKYYYGSGRYTIKGKVKTGCVSIPDINIAMWAMVVGGNASEEFEVTPIKPGTDTITVKAGRVKTVITVFVSPEAFSSEVSE